MTRAPVVRCTDLAQAVALRDHCVDHLDELRRVFAETTRYGRLETVRTRLAGRHAYLRFVCTTGDAMGMNLVGKGVHHVLNEHLLPRFHGAELLALSGNLCTDKKPAAVNWVEGRGKSVVAEAVIPPDAVHEILKVRDVGRLVEAHTFKNLVGSALAGCLGGSNAHSANTVAALFLACGQDPAQVVTSSACLVTLEAEPDGGARISVSMPSVEVGTVGGGTHLTAQRACLGLIGVAGSCDADPGAHARRLARVAAAAVLCGELSLLAALCSNDLIQAHMALNRAK
jgi:hydroxymethylglutaryl-CoA reductase (NADPH)